MNDTPIKAEARAALLAGAPTLWVAAPKQRLTGERLATWIFTHEPSEPVAGEFVGHGVLADDALAATLATPPGTVRRYALVPHPEGEETTNG